MEEETTKSTKGAKGFSVLDTGFLILGDLTTDYADGHGPLIYLPLAKLAKTAKQKKEPQMTQMSADLLKEGGHSCLPRREAGPPLPKIGGWNPPSPFSPVRDSDSVPAKPDQAKRC